MYKFHIKNKLGSNKVVLDSKSVSNIDNIDSEMHQTQVDYP